MTRLRPQHVIVKCPNWLGDVMMSLSSIKAVKRDNPNTQITFYLHEKFKALQPYLDWVDHFEYHGSTRDLKAWHHWVRVFKESGADTAILCVNNFKSAFLASWAGVKNRLGFNKGRSWFMTHGVSLSEIMKKQHRRTWYEHIVGSLIDSSVEAVPSLSIAHCDNQLPKAIEAHCQENYIAMATGAAYGPAKEYGVSRFKRLIEIVQAEGYKVILIGSPDDVNNAQLIEKECPEVINLVGQTSMSDMVLLLAKATGFIGNDSGPMHVSAMLGQPTVGIFGSTDPEWTGPVGPQAGFVYEKIECSPCYERNCPKTGKNHHLCMSLLSADQIFSEFKRLKNKNIRKT